MSILTQKNSATTKVLGVRIDVDLHREIDAVRLAADAAGLAFDVNKIVGDTLTKATRQARTELQRLGKPTTVAAVNNVSPVAKG